MIVLDLCDLSIIFACKTAFIWKAILQNCINLLIFNILYCIEEKSTFLRNVCLYLIFNRFAADFQKRSG